MDSRDLHAYAQELLADGEWHDYHQVAAKIAARVTPGHAIRRTESQRRTANARLHGGRDHVPDRVKKRDTDVLIGIGARQIAKQLLNGALFEIKPPGRVPVGQKFVRLVRASMTDPSDVHEELLRLLADGEWHDYHSIVAKAARVVTPGAAIRWCEKRRAEDAVKGPDNRPRPRSRPLSTEAQIRAGSRQMVASRLLVRAFEIKPKGRLPAGEPKWVRLNPSARQPVGRPDRHSPYLDAVLRLLNDGQWHDWEQTLAVATAAVPEDRAASYIESRSRTPMEGLNRADREKRLRTGARGVAFQSLVATKLLTVERVNGKPTRVRLRQPTDG